MVAIRGHFRFQSCLNGQRWLMQLLPLHRQAKETLGGNSNLLSLNSGRLGQAAAISSEPVEIVGPARPLEHAFCRSPREVIDLQ